MVLKIQHFFDSVCNVLVILFLWIAMNIIKSVFLLEIGLIYKKKRKKKREK